MLCGAVVGVVSLSDYVSDVFPLHADLWVSSAQGAPLPLFFRCWARVPSCTAAIVKFADPNLQVRLQDLQ